MEIEDTIIVWNYPNVYSGKKKRHKINTYRIVDKKEGEKKNIAYKSNRR